MTVFQGGSLQSSRFCLTARFRAMPCMTVGHEGLLAKPGR
jgi:hypothetical protein